MTTNLTALTLSGALSAGSVSATTVSGTLLGGIETTPVLAAADGAIAVAPSTVVVTKATAAALTLADPAVADNGTIIFIISNTAAAHTVTNAGSGFNIAGASGDVATFGGAIGDGLAVVAYAGKWLTLYVRNITFS